ncbi:WEB family protein At5g55860-like [Macadamia integrifolia]|uniref:WEB family protein At5g55860-like n=1 Tax=Macadamia integrifolia TaxID=60698 RepID=UPI001C52F371|nr:WEB family protein At5g55860-like [Macadamia integrifolia]XP_042519395.1 WEB family protein At5g55860-like [Macadamia integrifolia]
MMSVKSHQNAVDSPRAEVGEIDTRAPFQSVKAAVSLFGEASFSGEKPTHKKSKSLSIERVLAKETQLHLAEKELTMLREQLKNAETTKTQALAELEKAKQTVEDLSNKLNNVNQAKESAIKDTEMAKSLIKQLEEVNSSRSVGTDDAWKQELNNAREQYAATISELDAAKQELRKFQQDFLSSVERKAAAFERAEEAALAAEANAEKAAELLKELATTKESLGHVKLVSLQAHQKQEENLEDKNAQRQSYRAALEEAEKKLDPELTMNLEDKLAETAAEIETLQKERENARASDLVSVRNVTTELDDAKEALHKVAEDESTLQSLVESLKVELETLKKEHTELKEKEAETESIAGNLHVELQKSKAELETALAKESKAKGASGELISTLQQLSLESENARKEAEEMKRNAEELKKEAEASRAALVEAEKTLQIALKEAEEAKAAEAKAFDQIKILSERTNAARASTSESDAMITISKVEFESYSWKLEESDKLAEMKVAAAMAQMEAVKASENEALNRLEASQKEIEEMKAATEEALKRAEMAEAAKSAVDGELRRWREREQKRAAEAAALILESAVSPASSPQHATVQKQNQPEKVVGHKLDKQKSSGSKKALLPNLSGIFSRKKIQVEGTSPSYLLGEKPV